MCDSKGLITQSQVSLSLKKKPFLQRIIQMPTRRNAEECRCIRRLVERRYCKQENGGQHGAKPNSFALANPDPEITYQDAISAREDIIMATGRSDNPNQVNNVLGFPFIFRGALDVRSSKINEEMKLAAVRAIADLAKEPVPEIVNLAYAESNLSFGTNYIIPKPFDPRLITTVAPAVAKAAMDSGVAKAPIKDWDAYERELSDRLGTRR
jgi:malate dehydrogenase (oxaloacetate-decarboxylating)(NADP+)